MACLEQTTNLCRRHVEFAWALAMRSHVQCLGSFCCPHAHALVDTSGALEEILVPETKGMALLLLLRLISCRREVDIVAASSPWSCCGLLIQRGGERPLLPWLKRCNFSFFGVCTFCPPGALLLFSSRQDISITVLLLLQELTDSDVLSEREEASVIVDAIVDKQVRKPVTLMAWGGGGGWDRGGWSVWLGQQRGTRTTSLCVSSLTTGTKFSRPLLPQSWEVLMRRRQIKHHCRLVLRPSARRSPRVWSCWSRT